ncbi:MAG: lipase [Desulfobacterota bacterium]|nr:lipase [Thermodesulfobacteriota bacterium]
MHRYPLSFSSITTSLLRSTVFFIGIVSLLVLCAVPQGEAQTAEDRNRCPIILVHGFGGWGPEELNGYKYWGGIFDIQEELRLAGYEVYTAHVGPFSSNWDRAIELFYQIKGGQVDYGEEHCLRYGHVQRPAGKLFTNPLYPQWDAQHPVHLVGHSMGGQTIRMLAALLAGKAAPYQNVLRDTNGALFTPGEGWIKSITTIATPHNGTSLFDLTDNPAAIAAMILGVAQVDMAGIVPDGFYGFDLDQWDIHPQEGETTEEYLRRIFDLLSSSEDFSVYELSTSGAQCFNAAVNLSTEDASAYRFSFAVEQTVGQPYPDALLYVPDLMMNPLMLNTALLIGLSPSFTDPLDIGPRWRMNDGVVNTESMKAPLAGCADTFHEYDGIPQKGVWNFMGTFHYDHLDIIGHTQITPAERKTIIRFYLSLAELLTSLE